MFAYLQYFFNPRHLFSLRPDALQPSAIKSLLVISILFIVVGLVFQLGLKAKDGLTDKGYKKIANLFNTIGALTLVYLFFGWQGVILLGSRFWLLVLALAFIIWLVVVVRYFVKEIPARKSEIIAKKQKAKYIP